jgi:hypothetical protein|tara:strand:- start:1013 stop:1456 length:444 start_codon:yes stop_codon:yes gene_type:complete
MKLDIRGIIRFKMTDFNSAEEIIKYVESDDNFDVLRNILTTYQIDRKHKDKTRMSYEKAFEFYDEIWIIDGFCMAVKPKDDDEIVINPDLSDFLSEQTFDYKKEKEKIESSRIFLESLSVDSILDKISKVGIENITESEKRFLDGNM